VSKVIERAVAKQLHQYLTDNELLPRYQSAYRRHHSMETAMLRILSDTLTAADANQVTLLGLLDLSAAFDCVDHQLLLQRLRCDFGLSGTTLSWVTSFVTGWSQQVACNGQLSSMQLVQYGVPQGCVLGPGTVCHVHCRAQPCHCSARSQVPPVRRRLSDYVSSPVSAVHSAIKQFSRCLHDVEAWISASRLRLNPSKTVVLWLGSRHIIDKLDVHEVQVLSSTVKVDSSARDPGVVVDSRLTMSDHVVSVCRLAYYYLRQIRPVVQSMTVDAAKTLVQPCIASRLDYCNAVLHGITDNLLQRLQSVQNAAARLVTRTGRCEHVTQSVL